MLTINTKIEIYFPIFWQTKFFSLFNQAICLTKVIYVFILIIMDKKQKRVVVITGASSGIGLATAKKFYAEGDKVYSLSLSASDRNINSFVCDVTSSVQVEDCLKKIFEKEGRIDIFINNAGMGVSGAVEYVDRHKNEKEIALNLEAMIDCSRLAIPYLKQSRGTIMFTSSVAAVVPLPFQAVYSSSKSGVNMFCLALRMELAPFGVKVCAVMPGDTKTNFTAAREKVEAENDYENRVQKSVKKMELDEQNGKSPFVVANVFYKQSKKKNPKPLVIVGFSYKLIGFLAKILPIRLMLFIVKKIYG